jgi:DNA-directed RNA polymerase specialized sigma24 family protein
MPLESAPRPGARARWTLTPDAFDGLLSALDADRQRAAAAYEQLRHRLIGLLRWWGGHQPEELADETLDRVARRLAEGAGIPSGSLGAYVRGVARLVFYESTRDRVATSAVREPVASIASDEAEAASDCLDRCLAQLDEADRRLLLRYYDSGKASQIRRQLAEELGISGTALRIRAHRLRMPLERCVTECLERRKP